MLEIQNKLNYKASGVRVRKGWYSPPSPSPPPPKEGICYVCVPLFSFSQGSHPLINLCAGN